MDTVEYKFGMQIKDVKPYYKSWKHLYDCICKHYGRLSPPAIFDWYVVFEPTYRPLSDLNKCETIHWRLSLDYIKARMWDESKSLPYRMETEALANIAYYYATNYLLNMGGEMAELGEWLKSVAANERERIIKEDWSNG